MANESMKTGADLLIDALQKNGLQNIYGVVGIPVTDFARLAQLRGMKYFGFRREDAAVDAAAAAGYLTQKPGVALTVSAPGFLSRSVRPPTESIGRRIWDWQLPEP